MYRKNFNWMKEQVSTTVPPVHTNTFLKKNGLQSILWKNEPLDTERENQTLF